MSNYKTHDKEEVEACSLEYFGGEELPATGVFVPKYALRDLEDNFVERSPDDMHKRLATEIHRAESKYKNPLSYEKIYSYFKNFETLIPQGSPMSAIGDNFRLQSASNCFVIPSPKDSYNGILLSEQEQVQIQKRRGGCVEENTRVFTKSGFKRIKDVVIGEEILSYDINSKTSVFKKILDKFVTDVPKESRKIVKFTNGTVLKTSASHPMLTIVNDELVYKNVSDLSVGSIGIKPESGIRFSVSESLNNNEIAWFLGAHIGDGTAGLYVNYKKPLIRFRMLGDCLEVVEEYARVANKLTNSTSRVRAYGARRYASTVWQYSLANLRTNPLVQLIDEQTGRKTYSAQTPAFIADDLWIPYIAGLIDTDGYIRSEGTIELTIAAKNVIDDLCCWLSAKGIAYHVNTKYSKRDSESVLYRLKIHTSRCADFAGRVLLFLKHPKKISALTSATTVHKPYSKTFPLTAKEIDRVNECYQQMKSPKDNTLQVNMSLLRRSQRAGVGILNSLESHSIISTREKDCILQRTEVSKIDDDAESQVYYDIVVEDTNNYYAGNFGLVVDHNCGHDLSNIRPHGSSTTNAARSAEGIVAFMKRYSNASREVGQLGRVGALMLTLSIKHPDIFKFIDAKRDRNQITGANISIRTTDDFMKAVEKKQDFILQWPVDSNEPKVTMKVEASKIWDAIVDAAWDCAEPGLLFWDTAIRRTPSDIYKDVGFGSISTNPCQPGFATVYTRDGIRLIDDVDEGDEIWTIDGFAKVVNKKSNGVKNVVALVTSEGNLRCTEDHKVYSKGKLTEAKDATTLDWVNPTTPKFHKNANVHSRKNVGDHEVFTLTVDNKSHSYWSDGFNISNCGEIILSAYDSCRLMVINLTAFIEDPFTQKATFNFEKFDEVVVDAQRIMDDIIDLEIELIENIIKKVENDPEPEYMKLIELNLWKNVKEAAINGRRTGLGITALGDALASLNLNYGSPESIKKTEKIYKHLCINSYKSSCIMAGERGPFKVFSHEKEKSHEFLEQIWKNSPEVYELYKKNGRRNIANLTTAPTGSVSIVAKCWDWFGTTGGMEPAIYIQFVRNRKISPNDTETRVDKVDALGDRWHKYDVYHPGVKKFMQVTGKSAEESPYFGYTANEIDPIAGVHLQAAAQKWVCHSISRCLAVGESLVLTEDGFYDIGEFAEGITIPEGEFVNISKEVSAITKNGARKITHAYNNGEKNVLEVKMRNGFTITGTPEHRVCVLVNDYSTCWKQLQDLVVGDVIVGRKGLEIYNKGSNHISVIMGKKFTYGQRHYGSSKPVKIPNRLSKQLCYFLGLMCADGHVGKNEIRLTQLKNNVCEEFVSLMDLLFGLKVKWTRDKRSDKELFSLVSNSREVVAFMKYLGMGLHNNHTVPRVILRGGREYVKEFIKGLTLDGHIAGENICVLTSASRVFVKQVQQLLLNMGIVSTLMSWETKWNLVISDRDDVRAFTMKIGFAENRKQINAEKICMAETPRVKRRGVVPDYGLRKRFREEILPEIKSNRMYTHFNSMTNSQRYGMFLNSESALEMRDLGLEFPDFLIDPTYIFHPVVDKKEMGIMMTRDISVDDEQNYLVNGVLSHNTTNLPADVKKEVVSKVLFEAWKTGCKGITVYRDGSRNNVLEDSSKPKTVEILESERPEILECDIHRMKLNGKDWVCFVGMNKDRPWEIFTGLDDSILPPNKKLQQGCTVKRKVGTKSKYDLYFNKGQDTEVIFKDITSHFKNEEYASHTRLISSLLRFSDVTFVVEQLQKLDNEDMFSFIKVVSRVLKTYIKEGMKLDKECPNCKANALFYVEGCPKCMDCGYAKCL